MDARHLFNFPENPLFSGMSLQILILFNNKKAIPTEWLFRL
ncbi:hypothetical protein ALTERO38_51081 [Alteromonas sp. 38]|nr:hypothetical protein ALTERO38_51081 [Alteromonas sp. 38]